MYTMANDEHNPKPLTITKTGKILLGLTGGLAIGLTIISGPFLSPALRRICLPYVPATEMQIENVFQALKNSKGKLIDLGSGDGRIVIEAARRKFDAHGVELNPWLILYSRIDSFRKGLQHKTRFLRKNLWKLDLSKYDNVVIFGVDQMMSQLEEKILKECHKSCSVVACRFPLPNLSPCKIIGSGVDTVWLYKLST